MEPVLKRWGETILNKWFSQQEVDLIKAIPISLGNREDRLICGGTNNRIFSVKNAYHLHRQIPSLQEGGTSIDHAQSDIWKSMWKLQVPNAVRSFLWKACNKALPTFDNLQRRKLREQNICPISKLKRETSGHALWGCNAARDVWGQTSIKIMKMFLQCDLFRDIWEQLIVKLPKDELEMTSLLARLIWNRRNEVVHGKDLRHPNSIIVQAKEDLRSFHLVKTKEVRPSVAVCPNKVQKWRKPGKLKLNWNAALNESLGVIGIGAIIRDCQGMVLGSVRANRKLKLSPLIAKAYAMLVAIHFCKESGFTDLVLEGDLLQVVLKMQNSAMDWSQAGLILEDLTSILNSFTNRSIEHTKMNANMAVHLLAKDALNHVEDIFDLEFIPECIKLAVLSDSL